MREICAGSGEGSMKRAAPVAAVVFVVGLP
jgi:hypothetical protein